MQTIHNCAKEVANNEFIDPAIHSMLKKKNAEIAAKQDSSQVDQLKKYPKLAHGVLQCTNCSTIWNRDDNSAINIRRCMIEQILRGKRPNYLERPKKGKFI